MEPRAAGGAAGLCLHDLMLMPLDQLRLFFERIRQSALALPTHSEGETQALRLLFEEIGTRLKYLCDVASAT